ncbi:MAG: hypothetical protein PHT94_04875, partial [Candidatus Nanoarchaeia archaeon]|nr:hypothetical protein [Candidatus Nanoarchaeia archaeon]
KTFQGNVEEKLEKGYIRSRMIFEIVGKPKEHVKETMEKYISEISKVNDIIEYDLLDVVETEDNFFSAVAELDFLLKDINQMFHLCFQYMPSSIEIIEPESVIMKNFDLTSVANTLQGNLHNLDYSYKLEKQKNIVMSQNMAKLIRNFVNYLNSEERKPAEIEKITGVSNSDIKKIFEEYEKEKKAEQNNNNIVEAENEKNSSDDSKKDDSKEILKKQKKDLFKKKSKK